MRIVTQTTQNLGSSPPRWHGVMGIVTQTTQKSGASPFGGTWCFFFQLEGWAFIPSHHSRSSTQGKTPAVPHVGAKTNPKPLPLEKKNSNLLINLRLRLTSVVVQRVPEKLGGHHRPLHEDGLPFADAPGGEQAFPLRGKKTWFRGAEKRGHTPQSEPQVLSFSPQNRAHPGTARRGATPLRRRRGFSPFTNGDPAGLWWHRGGSRDRRRRAEGQGEGRTPLGPASPWRC